MPRGLTPEEDAFAIEFGRAFIIYLTGRGMSLDMIKRRLEDHPWSEPLHLVRYISDEHGEPVRLISSGLTPEIQREAVRASIERYRTWAHSRLIKDISLDLVDVIRTHPDTAIRVASLEAFPQSVPARYLWCAVSKKGKWLYSQKVCVKRAMILELAKRRHYRFLVEKALDPRLPLRYFCLILTVLDQAHLASLVRRSGPHSAQKVMREITDRDVLLRLLRSPRRAVREAAREKLGLPSSTYRRRPQNLLAQVPR